MARIAFLADALDLQYAGIHIYTREMIKAVTELDRSNEYFIVRSKKGGEFKHAEEIVVPIKPIPLHFRLRQFTQIPYILAQQKMDVVVEPGHFGPFNLPSRIKRITVIHDLTPLLFPAFHIRTSQFFHKVFLPSIMKRATHVVTNSEYTKQDVVNYFPVTKNKTTAILLGKDESFRPIKNASVLEKYKIPSNYFLYVGTLEPRKNLHVLLKAYEKFRSQNEETYALVLVGKKGWRIDEFIELLEQSPYRKDIILPGYVERAELPVLYTMATLFIYPSLYEGFGLPILEAMSCGTPVITSDVSSLPEVGEKAAFYFDPHSDEELCSLLLRLANDEELCAKHSERSLAQAAKFSWQKAGKELMDLFNRL